VLQSGGGEWQAKKARDIKPEKKGKRGKEKGGLSVKKKKTRRGGRSRGGPTGDQGEGKRDFYVPETTSRACGKARLPNRKRANGRSLGRIKKGEASLPDKVRGKAK